MNRRGFTLIELSVVLLILAIVAGAAALRIQRPMSAARMSDVIGQIEHYDHITRTAAREQGRALHLVVDLSAGELRRSDAEGKPLSVEPLRLPEGFAMRSLRVRDSQLGSGRTAISCSRQGAMPTYAMLVTGPGGRRQWIAFAGMTSQMIQVKDEQEAREIVDATGTRHNAG